MLTIPFRVSDRESDSAALKAEAKLIAASNPGFAQVIGDGADRVLVMKTDSPQVTTLGAVITVRDPAGATAEQFVSVPIVGPSLQISRDGRELVISYPDSAPAGAIEIRYGLNGSETWRPVGYVPSSNGSSKVVRIPIPADSTFFRLRY
jgi:hypothetical protein